MAGVVLCIFNYYQSGPSVDCPLKTSPSERSSVAFILQQKSINKISGNVGVSNTMHHSLIRFAG